MHSIPFILFISSPYVFGFALLNHNHLRQRLDDFTADTTTLSTNIRFPRTTTTRSSTRRIRNKTSPSYSSLYSISPSDVSSPNDQEWHPWDPASTTPQLLSALWLMISDASDLSRGDSRTIRFPNMQDNFTPSYMERLMHHMDVCKDVCDSFGVDVTLLPYTESTMGRSIITGFTVKSYRNANKIGTLPDDGDYRFAPDPFWDDNDDDWTAMNQSLMDAQEMDVLDREIGDNHDGSISQRSDLPTIVEPIVPEQDDTIVDVTKKWVSA